MKKFLLRMLIGLVFALFGLISYYTNVEKNPITGEVQHVSLSPRQEIVLGLKSRGQLAEQYGGLYPDSTLQNYVDEVGLRVVQKSAAAQSSYPLVNLKYSRADELESDRLGFEFMTKAGYSPKGLVELMQILGSANSGGSPPEFLSTHPNPGNGVELLQAIITKTYPQGIPRNLEEGQERFAQAVLTNHSKN